MGGRTAGRGSVNRLTGVKDAVKTSAPRGTTACTGLAVGPATKYGVQQQAEAAS